MPGPRLGLRAAASLPTAEDILERSRAKYASLKSYSDTGTVLTQYHSTVEQHAFTTYYRAPRYFFFEFRKTPKESNERYVIWCPDGEDFQDWWSTTATSVLAIASTAPARDKTAMVGQRKNFRSSAAAAAPDFISSSRMAEHHQSATRQGS
jgi:hypothetical protein